MVGTAVAQRKQKYVNLEDYYDAQISQLDEVNTQIVERKRQANLELTRLKKLARNPATRSQAVAELKSAQQKNRELLSLSADEIKVQRDGVAQESKGSKLPPAKIKAWSTKCDEAQKNIDELTELNDQYDSAKYL
ncbi:hypothetical protein C9427_01995 [Mesorhizobium helmanticense]|uniref:Uncharacterized protein n=1 Tax=Mesorhizobium helmanticense TaxID=1776423 RepID=A0A2T4J3E6_9HYPH|nr:hypothetical protein C9427_01995 [Mesorhizobium helmanticense]